MYLKEIDEDAVVLDACVLVPMPLCDTLLRCAEKPALFRAVWSDETLEEVKRTLVKRGFSLLQAEYRLGAMRGAFPGACVQVTSSQLAAVPEIPDSGDRHVVAAAVEEQAHGIVTFNLRHFPKAVLAPLRIEIYSPDQFLSLQFRRNPRRVLDVLDAQASATRQRTEAVLERMRAGLPGFVALLEN
jgi:predicted nucleic acid-binding protein